MIKFEIEYYYRGGEIRQASDPGGGSHGSPGSDQGSRAPKNRPGAQGVESQGRRREGVWKTRWQGSQRGKSRISRGRREEDGTEKQGGENPREV